MPLAEATAAAVRMQDAIIAGIDETLCGSKEVAAEREAAGKLAEARASLEEAKTRQTKAEEAYNALVSAGENPAPARRAKTDSAADVEDSSAWVSTRHSTYTAAVKMREALRGKMWREACLLVLQEMVERRQSLREKVQAAALELGTELITIDAIEKRFGEKK